MTTQPAISVVMPLYNHENYVEAALLSVLDQTFSDFELIVVDDYSTDGSQAKVAALRDDRIKLLVHSQNLGAHAAINQGISVSRGEYISILNSDDIYENQRLEILYKNCSEKNVSCTGTAIRLIDETGNQIESESHWWKKWYADLVQYYLDTQDIRSSILRGNFFITTSNFFFRKSLIEQIGPFRSYRYLHDYEFLFRAILNADSSVIFYDQEPLLRYRLHSRNSILENPLEANQETFDILIQYGARLSRNSDLQNILLPHLQKIRLYIEDQYVLTTLDYEQKLNSLKEQLLQLQENFKDDKAEASRQIELLRAEISKIASTRGYRFEKAMYELYQQGKNLISRKGTT